MTDSQQTRSAPTVLIVGAGPTGLTLACELARGGIAFRLIEAAPGPQPGSRGKGLQPRTLEVFDDLGIVDRVIAHGRMAMPTRSTGPDGRVMLGGTETLGERPDIPYPTTLITPQWRVEEALRMRLAELGGAVEFATALERLEPSDDGVSAVLVQGDDRSHLTTSWVVGCDGGHSCVRKQAGIAFEGETREELRMIVADLEVDGIGDDAWHMWRHEDGFAALCPLPSTNAFQYQASIAPQQDPSLGLDNMQAILERRSGRNDIRLRASQWSSLWRANIRLAARYRAGRMLVAGDAAHIHSPAGGQGMNTGIQDAHNLGWKLAAVARGAAPSLLDSYEAERRPIAAGVLALSNERLQQAIAQKGIPTQHDARTLQLGLNYRGSALARDDRAEGAPLRAGDRAPDATHLMTLTGQCRLFDLLRGGHFTLLDFGPAPAGQAVVGQVRRLTVVHERRGPAEVVDGAGQLTRAYGATTRTQVLIRPDGYIALISDAGDAAAIESYFDATGNARGSP